MSTRQTDRRTVTESRSKYSPSTTFSQFIRLRGEVGKSFQDEANCRMVESLVKQIGVNGSMICRDPSSSSPFTIKCFIIIGGWPFIASVYSPTEARTRRQSFWGGEGGCCASLHDSKCLSITTLQLAEALGISLGTRNGDVVRK